MEQKRKIAKVVSKVSFAEAEEADDLFWSIATAEDKLRELQRLRTQYKRFIGCGVDCLIEKVVRKKIIFEQDV